MKGYSTGISFKRLSCNRIIQQQDKNAYTVSPMKFYNRKKELGVLQDAIRQKGSAMVVISGRRRVGKSRLVDEFMKKNGGLKAFIVPKEEKQVAEDFSEVFADEIKPHFGTVTEAMEYFFAKSKERVLHIDEFPNLLEVNPAIPYELARLWEKYGEKTDKVLILSGSYAGMMERIFTRQKAPLFNRASFRMILEPLGMETVWEIQGDLGIRDAVKKIENYCIFGGVPYYYAVLEKTGAKKEAKEMFFGVGQLRDEGQDVLRQEFGASYKKYFSVLEAIGAGVVSSGEIANRMGIKQTTLSKYLQSLQGDFKLVERKVPFGQNPRRSKKGIYAVKDNLLSFWFSMAYGRAEPPPEKELMDFIGKRFEPLCMEFFKSWLSRRGENILKSGQWWGGVKLRSGKYEAREIDLVVETEKTVYIGECKWRNGKKGKAELAHLMESAGGIKTKKPVGWVLFSKSGFCIEEKEGLLLFGPERMVRES